MKRRVIIWLALCVCALQLLALGTETTHPSAVPAGPRTHRTCTPSRSPLSALPVRFEENVGQTDSRARFLAHVGNGVVFLTGSETVLKVARADDSVASVR